MSGWSSASLEFNAVQQQIVAQTETAGGAERVAEMAPSHHYEEVVERLAAVQEIIDLLGQVGQPLSLHGLPDVREALARAAVGGVLGPSQLVGLQQMLRISRRVQRQVEKIAEKTGETAPYLTELFAHFFFLPDWSEEVARCLDEDGTVRDTASPRLAQIRQQLRRLQSEVREALQSFLHDPRHAAILQEPIVTVRRDRLCIPVKQSLRQAVPGIVHDRSSSGATVFIEPTAVVERNNRSCELLGEEEEEIERILSELSQPVTAEHARFVEHQQAVEVLDARLAVGRYAREQNAICPQVTEDWTLALRRVRHPLLDPKIAVPIDVELNREIRGFVITGPNTGGKTVALKTVGLSVLLVQSGIPIPAAPESIVPVYRAVLADIGDEQSIAQNLSTFSGHLTNIVRMLRTAKPRAGERQPALLLFDELGAGTDPAEGAALAAALAEETLAQECHLLISTHFEALKAFAQGHPQLQNAGMEFNTRTLAPTYRLQVGVAGKSYAFAIAKRLGLGTHTVKRAREHLTSSERYLNDVLSALDHEKQQAQQAQVRLQALQKQAEEERLQWTTLQAGWEKERFRLQRALEAETRAILERTEEAARHLLQTAKAAQGDVGGHHVSEAKRRLRQAAKVEVQKPSSNLPPPVQVKVGDTVLIPSLNRRGLVVSPVRGGRVHVEMDGMRTHVPVNQLQACAPEGRAAKDKEPTKKNPLVTVHTDRRQVSTELNLRGQKAADALSELDAYIDAALVAHYGQVTIIHGKGGGVLRQLVHEYLRAHRHVNRFRLGRQGEGDIGVTVVDLS